MQIEIIGLIGVIGSGKSYKQKKYVEEGFFELNLADSMKEFIWSVIDWTPSDKHQERLFKDSYGVSILTQDIPNRLVHSISGRNFLINFGQKMKTLTHDNIWIEKTVMKINRQINNKVNKFVIGDVRFYNEVSGLKNLKYYREKEYDDKVDLKFIFSDYRSESYQVNREEPSEKFAISFLDKGLSDGEIINI